MDKDLIKGVLYMTIYFIFLAGLLFAGIKYLMPLVHTAVKNIDIDMEVVILIIVLSTYFRLSKEKSQ